VKANARSVVVGDEDAREAVRDAGLEILCTHDDCQGEVREGRVAYGWHPDLAERNRRILKGLALALPGACTTEVD
jgi:hypothetical protein